MTVESIELAGVDVTAGENMHGIERADKEVWLWNAYGKGVTKYARENPGREIRFIHRYWWADLDAMIRQFQPMIDAGVEFDISYKYARARLYSDTDPVFSDDVFSQVPEGTRIWCNLRNDDIYMLRWENPDYVREYILHLPENEKTPGFYMGSDGYFWGKEFICKSPLS